MEWNLPIGELAAVDLSSTTISSKSPIAHRLSLLAVNSGVFAR